MPYKSLRACVEDLERNDHLVRVAEEMDPCLEMAEIQRRLYTAEGPAVLFERVKGSPFPCVANLFGTPERCRFMFRNTLERVRKILRLKADPTAALRHPFTFASAPFTAWKSLPKKTRGGAALAQTTTISQLPAIRSWPDDGGPFITLPQVYTEDPRQPKPLTSNLGMYRIQLSGNDYETDREVGLHYQIHRGIGAHHAAAIERGEPLKVSVFIGGPPAHTLAAVMPMPEGLSELVLAGMLGGRRFRLARRNGYAISSDADFCIVGTVEPGVSKLEGPFGDHLGYYSLAHDFPVLRVENVYHRRGAIWPFTVVGRPPQEDTSFGTLIHELTAPLVPREIPGLHSMHAVDSAGVHPLMLALGSERYVPYAEREPRELLTIANALLGFSQASLAKYLLIAAREDDVSLDTSNIESFLRHMLERVNFERDLHFQTRTTIDTLDYSGSGLNTGSKLVIAAAGEKKRELDTTLPAKLNLPGEFRDPRMALPGVLVLEAPASLEEEDAREQASALAAQLDKTRLSDGIALVVLTEDSEFCARNTRNFLWVTFTRSNPSHDLHGAGSFIEHKHWGCRGPLVIDARIKSHHAPPLIEDPAVSRRVDELAARGGPLHGII